MTYPLTLTLTIDRSTVAVTEAAAQAALADKELARACLVSSFLLFCFCRLATLQLHTQPGAPTQHCDPMHAARLWRTSRLRGGSWIPLLVVIGWHIKSSLHPHTLDLFPRTLGHTSLGPPHSFSQANFIVVACAFAGHGSRCWNDD